MQAAFLLQQRKKGPPHRICAVTSLLFTQKGCSVPAAAKDGVQHGGSGTVQRACGLLYLLLRGQADGGRLGAAALGGGLRLGRLGGSGLLGGRFRRLLCRLFGGLLRRLLTRLFGHAFRRFFHDHAVGGRLRHRDSGGTITGVAEYIKAWNSMVRIVAVEPAECAAISGGFIGQHGISGIGPGFVPENYNPYVVDTVLTVTTADAERAAREVLFFDGVPACTSAGATLAAAVQLLSMGKAKRPLCVFAGRHIYG